MSIENVVVQLITVSLRKDVYFQREIQKVAIDMTEITLYTI